MKQNPLFDSPEQAINVTFHMVSRLAIVVGWLTFWFAHLALAVVLLYLLWVLGVSAEVAAAAARAMLQEEPIATAATLGISATGLTAGYWKLARWLNTTVFGRWLIGYLIQDAVP